MLRDYSRRVYLETDMPPVWKGELVINGWLMPGCFTTSGIFCFLHKKLFRREVQMTKAVLSKSRLVMVLAVLLCMFAALPAWAAGGNGSGGGSDPLVLESSTIPDGTQGVDITTAQITLTFSKNVVNAAVKENNLGCFSIAGDGIAVPFTVEMADDQLYPDLKNNVVLVFTEQLQPSSAYVITVAPELQSKSGVTLDNEVAISFTTAENAEVVPAADTPEQSAAVEENNSVPAETSCRSFIRNYCSGNAGSRTSQPQYSSEAAPAEEAPAALPATGSDTGNNSCRVLYSVAQGSVLLVYRRKSRNA